jgi:hypothetical protein
VGGHLRQLLVALLEEDGLLLRRQGGPAAQDVADGQVHQDPGLGPASSARAAARFRVIVSLLGIDRGCRAAPDTGCQRASRGASVPGPLPGRPPARRVRGNLASARRPESPAGRFDGGGSAWGLTRPRLCSISRHRSVPGGATGGGRLSARAGAGAPRLSTTRRDATRDAGPRSAEPRTASSLRIVPGPCQLVSGSNRDPAPLDPGRFRSGR